MILHNERSPGICIPAGHKTRHGEARETVCILVASPRLVAKLNRREREGSRPSLRLQNHLTIAAEVISL